MKKSIRLTLISLSAALLCGCSVTTPPAPIRPAVPPLRSAEAKEIQARCGEIRKLLSSLEVRGIALYPRAFELGYTPEKICAFLLEAGFNRIYLHITSETEFNEKLSAFLSAAQARNLPVEILLRQSCFHQRSRGNRMLQKLRDPYPGIAEMIRKAAEFNVEFGEKGGRISAVTVVAEPHKFTRTYTGTGQIFAWDERTYGHGLDNDLLISQALDMLKVLDDCGFPLTVGFSDFYHDLVKAGKLSRGTLADFQGTRSGKTPVLVMSTGNKPTAVVSGTALELAGAGKQDKVLLGIELASHTSVKAAQLRRRDWKDFIRILGYIVKENKKYPAFKGVVITPLAIFENIIMEQD